MSRTKGTYSISANIETNASAPLDARSRVNTLADLTDSASFPYPYVGMETFVVSEGIKYVLTDLPTTNAANWRPADAEELIKVALGEDIFEGHGVITSYTSTVDIEIVLDELASWDYINDNTLVYCYKADLKHPQSISNCVMTAVEGASIVISDEGSYMHEPLNKHFEGLPPTVGYYVQPFTMTVDSSDYQGICCFADSYVVFSAESDTNLDIIIDNLISISYSTHAVSQRKQLMEYGIAPVQPDPELVLNAPYLRVMLPFKTSDDLEMSISVDNKDYMGIGTQPPSLSDTDFWFHETGARHPLFNTPVENLWIGNIVFNYFDSDNSETITISGLIFVMDDDVCLVSENITGSPELIDLFEHGKLAFTCQIPTTPGSLQIGDSNGTLITQSDIFIGGKSILNMQSGGSSSGGGGEVDPAAIRTELETVFGEDLYAGVTHVQQVESNEDYPWYNEPTEEFIVTNENKHAKYHRTDDEGWYNFVELEYEVPRIYPAVIRNPWYFINFTVPENSYINVQTMDYMSADYQGTYVQGSANYVVDGDIVANFDFIIRYNKIILRTTDESQNLLDKISSIRITLPPRVVNTIDNFEIIEKDDQVALIATGNFNYDFDDNDELLVNFSVETKPGLGIYINSLEYVEDEITDFFGDSYDSCLSASSGLQFWDPFMDNCQYDVLVVGNKLELIGNGYNTTTLKQGLELIQKIFWSTPQKPGKLLVGGCASAEGTNVGVIDITMDGKSILDRKSQLDKDFSNANVVISKPAGDTATRLTLTNMNSSWNIVNTTEPGYTVYCWVITNTGIDIDTLTEVNFAFNSEYIHLDSDITIDGFHYDNFTFKQETQPALTGSFPCVLYDNISTNLSIAFRKDGSICIIPDTEEWDYVYYFLNSISVAMQNYCTYSVLFNQATWDRNQFGESSSKYIEIGANPNIVYSRQTKRIDYDLNTDWEITNTEDIIFYDDVPSVINHEWVSKVTQRLTLHNTNTNKTSEITVVIQSNGYIYLLIGSDYNMLWYPAENAPLTGLHIVCPAIEDNVGKLTVGNGTKLTEDSLTVSNTSKLAGKTYYLKAGGSRPRGISDYNYEYDETTGTYTVTYTDNSIICPIIPPSNYKIIVAAVEQSGRESLSYTVHSFQLINNSWVITVDISYELSGEPQELTETISIQDGSVIFTNHDQGLDTAFNVELADVIEFVLAHDDWTITADTNSTFEARFNNTALQATSYCKINASVSTGHTISIGNPDLTFKTNPVTGKHEQCLHAYFNIDSDVYYDLHIFDGYAFISGDNESGTAKNMFDDANLAFIARYACHTGSIVVGNRSGVLLTEQDVIIRGESVTRPAAIGMDGRVTLTAATGTTIYEDPTSYVSDSNDVPIVLTAVQIKAMIDKAIQESGGGGGETIIQVLDGTMGPYTQSRNMIVSNWADNTMVLEDHTQT